MGLSGTLCMMALLLSVSTFPSSGAASTKSQAYFDQTGDLPCHFTNSQNISLEELVVFWQKQDKLVLYELYKGKEKPHNVHPKYKGRTSFDQDNWTLRLHNLQIKDKGLYQCFIHRQEPKGLVHIYHMSSELSVVGQIPRCGIARSTLIFNETEKGRPTPILTPQSKAEAKVEIEWRVAPSNFSQPEIMLISNRTENSDIIINLTCSSMQGYPEPKEMYFILENENSTTKYDAVMKKSQNNVTELYSVSISFSFTIPSETNNVSIYCVLQPEAMETQLLSLPYNIDAKPPKEHHPDKGHILPVVALLVILVAVCGMVFFLTLKKRKKQQPDSSHERETTKVGEKENEQTEKRIEYQVSERSEEAESVVNMLKTASEDKSATHF